MRRKRATERDVNEASVDMSSMVDLSFLLLVFFLVTTTILASEQDLPLTMPTDGAPAAVRPVSIRIMPDNRIVLHPGQTFEEEVASAEEGHQLRTLRNRLGMLKSAKSGVQVDVQDGADYQRFMDVLNCLRSEGYDKVGITEL